MIISVDIGTSYTSACAQGPDGKAAPIEIEPLADPGRKAYLQTAVFLSNDGKLQFGSAAMNSRLSAPGNFRMQFKREFGSSKDAFLLGDQSFSVDALYTELLRYIKSCAEQLGPVEHVILTHPASYGRQFQDRLQKVAHLAGLFDVELVDEPTAAAMYYCAEGYLQEGQTLLIYDFGGGTFDASVIRYENGKFDLLTEAIGMERCGGIDFDRMIYWDMLRFVPSELQAEIQQNQRYRHQFEARLVETAVKAKHYLSVGEMFHTDIPVGYDMIPYELTRDHFNEMIAQLVSDTIQTCRTLLGEAKLKITDLSAVLMVGGSSWIPLVQTMVQHMADEVPVLRAPDLELAVVKGALYYPEFSRQPQSEPETQTETQTIIRAIMQNKTDEYGFIKGQGAFREEKLAALRQSLLIPLKEDVILAHLDGPDRMEKSGFAITESGIYSRASEGSARAQFTSWQQFINGKIHTVRNAEGDIRRNELLHGGELRRLDSFFDESNAQATLVALSYFWPELQSALQQQPDALQEVQSKPLPKPDPESEASYMRALVEKTMGQCEIVKGQTPFGEEKLPKLRKYLLIYPTEDIYLAYSDNTPEGSEPSGFALTGSGIYYRVPARGTEARLVSWRQFCLGELRTTRDGRGTVQKIELLYEDGTDCLSCFPGGTVSQDTTVSITYFWHELHAALREKEGVSPDMQPSASENGGSGAEPGTREQCGVAAVQSVVKETMRQCGLAHCISEDTLAALRRYLMIPLKEAVFLAHDSCPEEPQKNGFAVTERGIYYKEAQKAPQFYTWRQFLQGQIHPSRDAKGDIKKIELLHEGKADRLDSLRDRTDQQEILVTLTYFWCELQSALRELQNASQDTQASVSENSTETEPESSEPLSAPLIRSAVEEAMRQHGLVKGEGVFDEDSLPLLRQYLMIPLKEEVLLAYDSRPESRDKTGFAITGRGIYYKEPQKAPNFFGWRPFVLGEIYTARFAWGGIEKNELMYTGKVHRLDVLSHAETERDECQRTAKAVTVFWRELQASLRRQTGQHPNAQEDLIDPGSPLQKQAEESPFRYVVQSTMALYGIARGQAAFTFDNLAALQESLCIPRTEAVFLAHDEGSRGSYTNGFAITERGIYCKGWGENAKFISWTRFAQGEIRSIHNRDGEIQRNDLLCGMELYHLDYWTSGANVRAGMEALSRFWKKLQLEVAGLADKQTDRKQGKWVSVRSVVEESMSACGIVRGQGVFDEKKIDALRKYLQIPRGEEVFLMHDATLFGTGKNGFALARRGIYRKEIFGSPELVTWQNFLLGELQALKDDKGKYIQNRFKPAGNANWYNLEYLSNDDGELREKLVCFWRILQAHLRKNRNKLFPDK